MKWIQVKIAANDPDPVCAKLMAVGINSFEIENPADFEDFVVNQTQYWDIIDEELQQKKRQDAFVKLYLTEQERETLQLVYSQMEELRREGDYGSLDITCTSMDEEDWANNWKQYYKPLQIGSHLVICPCWEEYASKTGETVVTIDPGMAFGTGGHETTAMCLELLEQAVKPGVNLLDVGCGSGILSIAGLALGAKEAWGVDIDPMAVKIAGENGALNGFSSDRLHLFAGNLTDQINGIFDLAVANIIADVIITLAGQIGPFLKPGGAFICSGIIADRKADVEQALAQNGFTVVEKREKKDWVAYLTQYKGKENA